MLDKLIHIENRYEELREQMMSPDIANDMQKSIAISKEISSIQQLYDLSQEYKKYDKQMNQSKEMLSNETDPDMLEMAREELREAETKI
jgi:peptide chain release factor 1